jgi:selenoprotein W-related protein
MAEILKDEQLEQQVESFSLVPSEGGRFEFSVNGELIYSKIKTFRHAEEGELKKLLLQYLAGK